MFRLKSCCFVLLLAVPGMLFAADSAFAQPKIYWSTDTPMTVEVPAMTDVEQYVAWSTINVPLEEAMTITSVHVIVNWESARTMSAPSMLIGIPDISRCAVRISLNADDGAMVNLQGHPAVYAGGCPAIWKLRDVIFDDDVAPASAGMVRTGYQKPAEALTAFNGSSNGTSWNLNFYLSARLATYADCGPAPMTLKSWGLIFNAPLTPATAQNTLAVPWFVDNAGPGQGNPPANGKMATYVFLHNNRPNTFLGFVEYYTENGIYIGPFDRSAFVIGPNATIAFRPVADDPVSLPKGQEAPPGQAVPNRPVIQDNGNDGKSNGSLVIRWFGDTGDLVGMAKSFMLNGFESSTLLPSAVPVGP